MYVFIAFEMLKDNVILADCHYRSNFIKSEPTSPWEVDKLIYES